MKAITRRLQLGKLALYLYHRPLGNLRSVVRQGGPIAMRETERNRQAMEQAAGRLPPLPEPTPTSPTIHLYSGERFWYQTAFCLHSLTRAAGEPIRAIVNDDGTLQGASAEKLKALGRAVHLRPQREIVENLDRFLPRERYPIIRKLWSEFFLIRKITDVHAGAVGWNLFIDSDLLFFRKPAAILDWLRAPDRPLHEVDVMEAYGYTRGFLAEIAGAPIPEMVNTGLCGLRSDDIDWAEVERWCDQLITRKGRHYYMEQALTAMISSRYAARMFAPRQEYITMPSRAQVEAAFGTMHHYVDNSKRWYFRYGWRHVMPPESA
jgi:hypothetical protein